MQVIILGNESAKKELAFETAPIDLLWIDEADHFQQYPTADVFMDLEFENSTKRTQLLRSFLPKPVIINSVPYTLAETHPSFVRINAWPTLLSSPITEGSVLDEKIKVLVEPVFQQLNKQIIWLPDDPGFVTPQVISMIINEAYFALSDGVSTKEEIDTAMKLGTNYPYGPFEWGKKIGLKNIVRLLQRLSQQQKLYEPCALLIQEADCINIA